MDPISAFLAGMGIDPMALVESLAFALFSLMAYGVAISFWQAR